MKNLSIRSYHKSKYRGRRIDYKSLTPAEFAVIWNNANSAKEVSDITGTSISNVSGRAARYRKKGVYMKRFGNYLRTVEEINELKALVGELEDPLDPGSHKKAILKKFLEE